MWLKKRGLILTTNNPRISVVTVCFNAEKCIGKTIDSVVGQTYGNVEYIIVDGNSTDDTLRIVSQKTAGYDVKIISEPDNGIYDAMNKGAGMATGDYIEFLNAGDVFLNEDILENVAEFISSNDGDIFYGSIEYMYPDGHREDRIYGPSCGKKIYYLTGDCINHQAMFALKRCFDEPFDTAYKLLADREWMMRMHKKGYKYTSMPFKVCGYSLDEGSASLSNSVLCKQEADACIKKHFSKGYWIYAGFEFCRNNAVLKRMLHQIYSFIYIRN